MPSLEVRNLGRRNRWKKSYKKWGKARKRGKIVYLLTEQENENPPLITLPPFLSVPVFSP
jgi:hypothetical protein